VEIKKVTVNINGSEYILKSDYPEEHVLKLADYVNNVIEEVSQSYPKLSPQVKLILSALNIAEEFFMAKEENNAVKKEMVSLKSTIAELEQQISFLMDELEKTNEEYQKTKEELRDFLENFDK